MVDWLRKRTAASPGGDERHSPPVPEAVPGDLLRDTQDRLMMAVRAGRVGLWDWDLRTDKALFSAEYKRQLGYEEHEISDDFSEWERRVHPEDLERAKAAIASCRERSQPEYRSEYRMRHRDGTYRWILSQAAVFEDASGTPVRMLGTHVDITLRKRREQTMDLRDRLHEFALTHSLTELLQEALDQAGLLLDSPLGFFHSVDPDEQGVRMQVWSTQTERAFCAARKADVHYDVALAGIWADAVRERRPVVHNDYMRAPGRKQLPPGHAELVRELVVPVLRHGRVVAVMGLGNKPSDYTDDDVENAALIGDTTWSVAAKKMAETALQDSEVRFRRSLDLSPDAVLLHQAGRVTYANEAALTLFGAHRPDQLLGTPILDRVHPDSLDVARERMTSLSAEGTIAPPLQQRVLRLDGTPIDVEVAATMIHMPDGPAIEVIFRDVTRRVRAERALRESEEKFRSVVDAAGDPIVVLQAGKVVLVNPATLKLTGHEAGELPGSEFLQHIAPEDRVIVEDRAARRAAGERLPPTIEIDLLRKDGSRVTVETRVAMVSYDGAPADLVVARDVTDRRKAERALAHSHALMRYIIEHNRSSVAVHDKDMRYIYVSQRYLDEYRVEEKDVIGRHHYDVFPDLPQKWRDVHRRVLAGEVCTGEDDPFEREDGTVEWTRWECRPWYEADGSIGGLIVYTEVTTERKRMEDQLRLHERRLGELAAELLRKGEWERRRIAMELHDDLGQALIAAGIAAKQIRAELPDTASAEKADELVALIGYAIDGVRLMSTELSPPVLRQFGLGAALQWLADRVLERYGLTCDLDIDETAAAVKTDAASLLLRTAGELLNNVHRHSGADRAKIRLSAEGDRLELTVQDAGAGFDTALLDAEQSHDRFGLFSIREEVALAKGTTEIDSAPGSGTRVRVRVPTDLSW